MQYVLLLFHIVLKLTRKVHSRKVSRSSVGRALYRESGPSQDGDPVPGNLPFFVFFYFFIVFLTFFLEGSFLFRVCTKIKNNVKCLRILVFLLHFISKDFLPLTGNLPFSYTPKLGTCIGMLLNGNVIKLNIFFL